MTQARRPRTGAVGWLFAQSVAFGLWAALMGIVANAMFLEAYGAAWLPATYIAIGVVGVLLAGAIAQAGARGIDLLRIATVVLGGSAALFLLAWVIAVGTGTAWVSAPLLVLFPILIELGFVFIGAQAGRVLDIAGIKASFPRIMAGFPVGAIAGGLAGPPLAVALGGTEQLLLVTALAQGAFAMLVWATGRRFPDQLGGAAMGHPAASHGGEPAPSLRALLAQRFVALIIAYQVLSALGSQLSDYLVFDRAAARYPSAEELAGFVGVYTAVLNAAILVFLLLIAGPLLRRFGLRLGITANPLAVTVLAALMLVVFGVAGGASLALLVVVSATRILDIVLSDGTTRTSVNAIYQVLPERIRLSVQASVEGMGAPIAIGISGLVIIVINGLPDPLPAMLLATTIVCAIWTAAAVLLYRAYGPALAEALRDRRVLDPAAADDAIARDAATLRRLLDGPDPRAARLGIELLGSVSTPWLGAELAGLADDPRPDVRLAALRGLAAGGDEGARTRLAGDVRDGLTAQDPAVRHAAAAALAVLGPDARAAAAAALSDPDPGVRRAALDAVQPGDEVPIGVVVAALDDRTTAAAAAGAIERLGDSVLPTLATTLDQSPAAPGATRLVCATGAGSPARDAILTRHVGHPDRALGLLVMERLARPGPATPELASALDAVLADDLEHARRILRALLAVGSDPGLVRRALEDELDLVRRRVAAGRLARFGTTRLGPAIRAMDRSGAATALAAEALEVELGAGTAHRVVAVLDRGLSPDERLGRLGGNETSTTPGRSETLRDLVEDPHGSWRSPWLLACAIHEARADGLLPVLDLAPARAVGDPIVDEELRLAAA